MNKEWSTEELQEIASQLSNPSGGNGIKTAERMADNNANMTVRTIETLEVRDGDMVLEIGHGNASHLPLVLSDKGGVRYYGIDISETMVEEASKLNAKSVNEGRASFTVSSGSSIPFDDDFFDKIFTVNTLYFWQDPVGYASDIFRVLKPGGCVVLTITDKRFMEKLPFTRYGFRLYDRAGAEAVLTEVGFTMEKVLEEIDITTGILGQPVERDIILIRAFK